jgi:hypothetical protein
MAKVRLADVEDLIREIFEEGDGKVSSVDSTYEKIDEETNKLVISMHHVSMGETIVMHTKFIFKTDKQKSWVIEDSFIYLYDINCTYHRIEFENKLDLKNKIKDIIESNDFGKDMQILSDFIEAPAMFLNYYMKKNNITDYSIFDVTYDPKFKTISCDKMTFDFDINVNNSYTIKLSIKKIEAETEDEVDIYKFHFSLLDSNSTVESDTLKNIHFTIGSEVARMLDEKLK